MPPKSEGAGDNAPAEAPKEEKVAVSGVYTWLGTSALVTNFKYDLQRRDITATTPSGGSISCPVQGLQVLEDTVSQGLESRVGFFSGFRSKNRLLVPQKTVYLHFVPQRP